VSASGTREEWSESSLRVQSRDQPGQPPRWVIVNYDLRAKHANRLRAGAWGGVILDEAHFIKNASGRTSHVMKLLGVSENGSVARTHRARTTRRSSADCRNCASPGPAGG
jgi:hypothetical protein